MSETKILDIVPGSKGDEHVIKLGRDSVVYCDCKAWKYSRSSPKTCKHVDAYIDQNGHPCDAKPSKKVPQPVAVPVDESQDDLFNDLQKFLAAENARLRGVV